MVVLKAVVIVIWALIIIVGLVSYVKQFKDKRNKTKTAGGESGRKSKKQQELESYYANRKKGRK